MARFIQGADAFWSALAGHGIHRGVVSAPCYCGRCGGRMVSGSGEVCGDCADLDCGRDLFVSGGTRQGGVTP